MDELKLINEIVQTTNTNDFRIDSYEVGNLLLIGSFDFCYYHSVEIRFKEVLYISLPTEFDYPIFRIANLSEIQSIRQQIWLEPEDVVYCIEAETSCSIKRLPFYIVAQGINVCVGTVYYYWKDNLNTGERLASWVSKLD